MAYSRWSFEGALYVYMDVRGGITCMGAAGDSSDDPCTYTRIHSEDELREHMAHHEALGHNVDSSLVEDILEDVEESGGWDVVNRGDQ
ncbi:hypothetical protein [Demequina globuliformis]|uniref:hypothetical protein n=1 Tax=Demequina globuliformis TaxID=676202 RepID=UPI000783E663|nr:hypothetical protein [Demequina globuliformis]